ncbi:glycosyltransferase family 4 protein [Diaminobutyricibacter sp. McL0608]|uniref:glycosyltransferase family 4 protein n=1 Tax=Leifsonia sp. McL0608 TaxID=3143537 RepID=UPI0031F2E10F
MKIAIVSQYYKPEAVPIPAELAAGLSARGHSVRVLTGFPNYPAGRLFPGYRQRLSHVENDGKATVRRVPLFLSHSTNVIGRVLNYLSFGLSALMGGRHVRGADVVYVYATPMTAAIAPSIWRWTRRTPFVLHVQDVWPESITGSNLVKQGTANSLISTVLTPWLRYLYRSSAATIAIAPTMAKTLIDRGLPPSHSHTVFNWGNEPSTPVHATTPKRSDACTVMYAGNIGELQDLETVVRAAHAVNDLTGFRLVFRGSGVALPRLRELTEQLGATNIRFEDPVGTDRLGELYSESDYQLVPLRDLPIFEGTVPSKFQASLAFGVPVITAVRGDVEGIVRDNQLGFTAEPENAASLESAFRNAYALSSAEHASMAQRANNFYYSTMSKETGVSEIERILDKARQSHDKKASA